jgi:ribonuclease HII
VHGNRAVNRRITHIKMLQHFYGNIRPEAGCDEAGRGCLAGPVVASAVILHSTKPIAGLNDSKKLNHTQRIELKEEIISNAIAWSVAFVDNQKIDEINILNASILAMHHALDSLKITPEIIIVDGNKFKPYKDIPHVCIVKGDGKYMSIAAASILAKTFRDEYMENIHNDFPMYLWSKNKGYPTPEHKLAIHANGLTHYHRRTFSSAIQLKLFYPPMKP